MTRKGKPLHLRWRDDKRPRDATTTDEMVAYSAPPSAGPNRAGQVESRRSKN